MTDSKHPKNNPSTRHKRIDRRPLAIFLVIALIVAIQAVLVWVPIPSFYDKVANKPRPLKKVTVNQFPEFEPPKLNIIGPLKPDPMPSTAKSDKKKLQIITQRFHQAVSMLHMKRYEYALAALDSVIELAPQMPEAHTNRGFAYLGLGDYRAAYESFEAATILNQNQLNAYYGLALALYGLEKRGEAVGAMESYVHQISKKSPEAKKAMKIISGWREELDAIRMAERNKLYEERGLPPDTEINTPD